MTDYSSWDATEIQRRIAGGELQPIEAVEAAVSAIEAVNPKLNAVVHRMYDAARAAAVGPLPAGPLSGVPMVVKDFDGFVKGVPFTASTSFLQEFVPDHDAEAIARLRRAGAVFLAKTNLPELAIFGTTESRFRGACRNPWNLAHSTGGSSGGSAALVAARAVPVAHGGDGGGSLRIPASACGVVALKPSRGRVPMGPDQGEGWGGYVQWGGLTRSVRDTALLLDVMSGPIPGDLYAAPTPERPFVQEPGTPPGKLRIAFSGTSLFGKATDPACLAALDAAVVLLRGLGHQVEEARPSFNRDKMVRAYLTQVGVSIAAEMDEMSRWTGKPLDPQHFEPATWFLSQVGRVIRGTELQEARDAAAEASQILAEFHTRWDLFLTPTLAYPPIVIGELAPKPAELFGLAVLRTLPIEKGIRAVLAELAANSLERTPNTMLFNQTGQPAISLPLGMSPAGLPLGIQLVAPYGHEARLLQIAAQIEEAAPWEGRRPTL